jgi:glycosyltransferase involved in cell wall biosynthesis
MKKTRTGGPVSRRHVEDPRKPLVSIITVCRNAERTIGKTIESVLNQTYPQIEYLIIDGASTDATLEIVKRYEPRFKGRLRWVSEKDRGIYDAMNKGIALAQGRIIGLVNSDDWYEPEAVELVARSYREHGDAVYYGILRVMEDGKEVMLIARNHQFLHRDVVAHPAYFVAKNIYDEHGLFRLEFKYAADFELMMRLMSRHVQFVQIDAIMANFSSGGATTVNELRSAEEYLRIRCEYGLMTRKSMLFRIARYRISSVLERINRGI